MAWVESDSETLDRLRGALGASGVITDPDVMAAYGRDITGRFAGSPRAVLRPGSTEEVTAALSICHEQGQPVVPQGGNSGLVGGGVPREGEIVMSLTRMSKIELLDAVGARAVVEAGVTLESLQRSACEKGLYVGIDHAARSAATIGGMAATNAGGGFALRYGPMRAQVGGLDAVLADGTLLQRLSGLRKDNAGYDLSSLLVGSEGTLAVITRVEVRLWPLARSRVTALVGLERLEDAALLAARLHQKLPSLVAADFFEIEGMALVLAHRGLREPFDQSYPVYLIVECAEDQDPLDPLAAILQDDPLLKQVTIAQDTAGRGALWAYRELLNEAVAAHGIPHKLHVSVAVSDIARFAGRVRTTVAAVDQGARVILYGHLADGNVHVNILGPEVDDDRTDLAVLELVADHGGSISAEHGVGIAKTPHLHLSRRTSDIALMRRVKHAFDPRGILNPGRVLPAADG